MYKREEDLRVQEGGRENPRERGRKRARARERVCVVRWGGGQKETREIENNVYVLSLHTTHSYSSALSPTYYLFCARVSFHSFKFKYRKEGRAIICAPFPTFCIKPRRLRERKTLLYIPRLLNTPASVPITAIIETLAPIKKCIRESFSLLCLGLEIFHSHF